MLYKHPGPHDIHGDKFDYMICHQNEMDKYLADGWYLTTGEAKAVSESDSVSSNDVEKQEKVKLSFDDFSDLEKENIMNDPRAMMLLAEIHNTTYHTIRKIKGRI